MKLSVCSIILTLTAMISMAHADDPLLTKSIRCTGTTSNDPAMISPNIQADNNQNMDGHYLVNGLAAGVNKASGESQLELSNHIPLTCSGVEVKIDFNTQEGSIKTWSRDGSILSSTHECEEKDATYTHCTAE